MKAAQNASFSLFVHVWPKKKYVSLQRSSKGDILLSSKPLLIVISGPTGVGKTALAIRLAVAFNTSVVSADSRQIYREMEIGTAKPTQQELDQVQHFFINSHSIQTHYNAAIYGEEALAVINTLFQEHDKVIMVGGSGLYIKAVCEGFDEIPELDPQLRQNLIKEFERQGLSGLQQKMKKLDPEYFEKIDQKNPVRLIRALEVKMGTGFSLQTFQGKAKRNLDFDIIHIGLELDREGLYARIDKRMDQMIELGLFEEARSLFPHKDLPALQTVGYQEVFGYINGAYGYDEAVRLLKRNSRRYAKRQLTWFKRNVETTWFYPHQWREILEWISNYQPKK